MSRYGLKAFAKKKLAQTRLPDWMSRNVGPADDPMGMVAVGTILIAIGWMSFRLWRRLRRRGRVPGKAKS